MDYLTILTTRYLLLFSHPPSPSTHMHDLNTPPTTPTASLPTPQPIAIPISNLTCPDTHLFFFLQNHILRLPEHLASRAERAEAEVMAWRELAKAGTFIRDLGMAAGRGDLREAELKEVARRCGLALVAKKIGELHARRKSSTETLRGDARRSDQVVDGVMA